MGITTAARLALSALAAVAFCAGCSSDRTSDDAANNTQPIKWVACPPGHGAAVQCATIDVPLDWNNPGGKKIQVGVNRLPASDTGQKIGDLVFNPGGPGGAGTEIVAAESGKPGLFPASIRQRFDLIGFDPRGVGSSQPAIHCDPDLANRPPNQFPSSQQEFDNLVAANRAFGETCRRLTGDLIDHVDTVNVARDLEVLRQRLGGAPLNYLGLSYGTEIGAEYARLFPDKSRTLALDGALVHSQPAGTMSYYESIAFEDSWNRFALWCRSAAECVLRDQDPSKVLDDLVARAEQKPLPAPGCQISGNCRDEVGAVDLLGGIQGHLLFKDPIPNVGVEGWPGLAAALDRARNGDASDLAPAKQVADSNRADLAVGCADFKADFDTYPALKAQQTLLSTIAPHTRGVGQSYSYVAWCQGWPAEFTNPPRETTAKPTIAPLLVNATHDPSTSYGWAQLMLTQIQGAVLVTRDGDGHTSFLHPGHTQDTIARYLIDGTAPATGLVLPD
ncbi:alpha/beta hydrolase [Nocardia sp. NBC_01499]|uniref:alpha/beta hydrolase n=1 Tax=Nocardia sp. NBC_01499 TaxID=2903597 RepID=UPI003863B341